MMVRVILVAAALLHGGAALAQSAKTDDAEKAWARTPKQIAFQNDSQWEDNRWQQTDVGPFLSASIVASGQMTPKGMAVRVGDKGQAAVCFDTARVRISAAWTGDFLRFGPRRFGLIQAPQAAGKPFFSTSNLAGWANGDGRFKPRPGEITQLDVERGYTAPGTSVTHLPKDWINYKGFYTSGRRVVWSYSVGNVDVLESPWYVQAGKHDAFVRSLEIAPSKQALRMLAANSESQIALVGDVSLAELSRDGRLFVKPHSQTVRFKLLIARKDAAQDAIQSLKQAAGDVENLSEMIKQDAGRFSQVLKTRGTTTASVGPYVIDTLTIPFDNPWKALFFTAGHDFFSDGSAAVCTAHGDVWTVDGIDRDLKEIRWRRFATGLFQPLGLKIVDDKVYVLGRDQITRLHDDNGDGETDFYENFNNDQFVTPRAHDYVTCLDTDPRGNFYYIHARTGVMRVAADGSSSTSIAEGFRNPNGMAVSPSGLVTAAPQQGEWTPESCIIVVKNGGYYGYRGPKVTPQRPTGWDLPMCFIPRSMDNSGGAQVWVQSDRWGPLDGRMLHLSYGQCRLLLTLIEKIDGGYQGGTIKFPTTPADFESGIMRGRFRPQDGQLYVTGLRGWQTRSVRDGCFQRVRYVGGPLHLPVGVETFTNGVKLTFSEPLDQRTAQDPDNYFAEQWNYRWSQEYGSPDFSVENPTQQGRDEVPIVSATLVDERSVFLEMPGRRPVHQLSINWLLTSAKGENFRGSYAHTINVTPRRTYPETKIVRRERKPLVAIEVANRLKPGVAFRFESVNSRQVDARSGRLVALRQSVSSPSTPFLSAGPFRLTIAGMLKAPLSGFFDFKLESSGDARFWINDEQILGRAGNAETSKPILLRKGHNRIRIEYLSPTSGDAELRLLWKGYNFAWEPVPPRVLFHDGGEQTIISARHRRLGRALFARHRCFACHKTDVGPNPMFELTLPPPDLDGAGDRLNETWLRHWLLSPRSLKPGTHMPRVLRDKDSAKRDAADLAAYLVNVRSKPAPQTTSESSSRPNGADLYEVLGCMACHHIAPPDQEDPFDRMSLHFVDAKYRAGALARYLKEPGAHHAATRMPDFQLSGAEAATLAAFLRKQSKGAFRGEAAPGDPNRGRKLFAESGCQNCHAVSSDQPVKQPMLTWKPSIRQVGCLADGAEQQMRNVPDFSLSPVDRNALLAFLKNDRKSLSLTSDVETSGRLVDRLQCLHCHDRDGQRSSRPLILFEQGSGATPEVVPSLMWAGEKFKASWNRQLLGGELDYKPRPWIKARMPAFPNYAKAVAVGLAAEHGVDPNDQPPFTIDAHLAAIGEKLTLQTALDCRQCHGIGSQLPRGDKNTKIALGVNFSFIRDRMRHEAYHRFMLDPPRYDFNTKMIKLSEDGMTTKIKQYFDADAHKQFEAVWHYIQAAPPSSEVKANPPDGR